MVKDNMKASNKQLLWWLGALVTGTVLGLLHSGTIDAVCGFIATVYTRLFQFLAVPTVALTGRKATAQMNVNETLQITVNEGETGRFTSKSTKLALVDENSVKIQK